jgi:RecB family endonuclease NucS
MEVQRFIEDHVLQRLGLEWVCSSVRGRGRIGFIDTVAHDEEMNPVIIEYKWDMVDGHTIAQVGTLPGVSSEEPAGTGQKHHSSLSP